MNLSHMMPLSLDLDSLFNGLDTLLFFSTIFEFIDQQMKSSRTTR